MNLDEYIKTVAARINESCGIGESVSGKHYDWSGDFSFSQEVAEDLRKRDLLTIGVGGITAMVPVNRPDAPLYRGEADKPYNILHIKIDVRPDDREMYISRFFGYRLDWTGEEQTDIHVDWTDIPILSRKTVQSLIDMYNANDVVENFRSMVVEYAKKHEKYLDMSLGTMEYHRGLAADARWAYTKVEEYLDKVLRKRADKKSVFGNAVEFCNDVVSGKYRDYKWTFDYPEFPSEDEIRRRFEDHEKRAEDWERDTSEYFDTHQFTGD